MLWFAVCAKPEYLHARTRAEKGTSRPRFIPVRLAQPHPKGGRAGGCISKIVTKSHDVIFLKFFYLNDKKDRYEKGSVLFASIDQRPD
jgi:hypothetical protein